MWPMVQTLLEDRFKLKIHRDTRDLPVYNLVQSRSGLKMKLSADQTPIPSNPDAPPLNPNAPPQGASAGPTVLRGATNVSHNSSAGVNVTTLSGNAIQIGNLRGLLQSYAARPVIDKTNLKGLFDFRLQFSQDPLTANPGVSTAPAAAPLFTAIEEQLGLKLESARGPVEVLVIDSIQKPSEN
jgi:uncharacterized protein (TIGR03435 family)